MTPASTARHCLDWLPPAAVSYSTCTDRQRRPPPRN